MEIQQQLTDMIMCVQMCPPTTTVQQSVESVEFVVSMSRLCTYVLHIITPTALLSGCSWRDGDAAFCQVTVDTCCVGGVAQW